MFESLVESGSHKEDLARKGSFFFGTLVIYGVVLISLFVLSIYLYNTNLENENLEFLTLVAPVPVQPQQEIQPKQEVKPATPEKTVATRTELIANTLDPTKVPQKVENVASKVPPVQRGVPTAIGRSNVDAAVPSGPIGPATTGGGGPSGPVVKSDVPPPPPPPPPPPKKNVTVSGGVLNGKAISKPAPAYPPIAKAARAQGTVTVQILVDETGRVISATAVSGNPLLQAAAVSAARQARFSPTMLSGQPVKVSGVITYNFVLQ